MKYEDDYLKNNSDWHQSDATSKTEWISPYIQGQNIAEIGCGSGEVLKTLAKKYSDKHFVGYEISKTAYDLFLKTEKSNIEYFNKDFFQIIKNTIKSWQ